MKINKKPKILIVDDVELNRVFLNDILEDEYDILEASNGKEVWYEFMIRSLWTDEIGPVCIGFIGKMSNIHIQAEETKLLRTMAETNL